VEGDPHLSGNVLLWQTDYSQLYFTKTLYPEFTTQELGLAIADYKTRMRRHGK
jgi:undecaprenyl diphosphate synthase